MGLDEVEKPDHIDYMDAALINTIRYLLKIIMRCDKNENFVLVVVNTASPILIALTI